jgi:hypothetical protein
MGSNEVPIDRSHLHEEPINFPHIAIHFKRTWLAYKVRKCQKEALKGPGRHDSTSNPTSKFYDETLLARDSTTTIFFLSGSNRRKKYLQLYL